MGMQRCVVSTAVHLTLVAGGEVGIIKLPICEPCPASRAAVTTTVRLVWSGCLVSLSAGRSIPVSTLLLPYRIAPDHLNADRES